jgi:hypothetical protein
VSPWFDPKGNRKRKSFKSKSAAEGFQKRQRLESAAKKARASEPSRSSARRGTKRTPKARFDVSRRTWR